MTGTTSLVAFTVLVALVAVQRLGELAISRRNTAWCMSHGGVEYGRGHYPAMVTLHTGLLVGAVAEAWIRRPPFLPVLAAAMLGLVLVSQALRVWSIASLGHRWNTRVIVIPGLPLVRSGPYRWFRHPNYAAVVVEGVALPVVHTAWITASAFTVLNAGMLILRIRVENAALRTASSVVATT